MTPAEAADGSIWWTGQSCAGNNIGRIDLITLDRPNSRPYGIKVAADGSAWVACPAS